LIIFSNFGAMEHFVVSARKYRPQTFDTVVGQHSITSTLKNAIKNKQLAQAFLFCGSRGVGKTTTARILAKTINCFNPSAQVEACNACESCLAFNDANALNVYELDAASNNSVDDIRNLIDQVRIAPQLGAFKVYIIDEVHMLTTAAFNAFLKTLEEPPKHAIFILATTEKHKIIPTILSRCQIFDFNRIKVKDIADYLLKIAQNEGVTAEAEGLHLIAQKADGALRDALSIFDQIVSFTEGNLSYAAVLENLHVLDYDYYFKLIDFSLTEDIPGALLMYNEILSKGFYGHQFIIGLGEHLRNLLVGKAPKTIELLEVSDSVAQKYKAQSAATDIPFILRALSVIEKADITYRSAKNQRLLVEIALMQICSLNAAHEKKKD
jgi:DNA polymerase-3 subunit gamma/tau